MRSLLLILVTLLFFLNFSWGQNHTIDSLNIELQKAKDDTSAMNDLKELCQEYLSNEDNKNLFETAGKLGSLSDKLLKEYSSQDNSVYINIGKKFQAYSLSYTGVYYMREANYAEALINFAAAMKIRESLGDKKGMASIYNNRGIVYQSQGNFEEALKNHFAALKIREALGDKAAMSASYNSIGYINFDLGNFEEALKNHFAALKLRKELGDKIAIASSYNNIGIVYKSQGKSEEAIQNYKAAFALTHEIGYKQGDVYYYNNMGTAYNMQGNFSEALKMYFTALKLNESLPNKITSGDIYNNIGQIFADQQNYTEAIRYYQEALKVFEELGDKSAIAFTYNNIGSVNDKNGNHSQALKNYLFSLKIEKEIGDKPGIASTYNNIGLMYQNQRNYDDALKNYFASLKISEATGDKEIIAETYQSVGDVYAIMGNSRDAVAMLDKAEATAKKMDYKKVLSLTYKSLAEAYTKSNNYQKANKYLRLYSEIRDTLFNAESSRQIAEMKSKYETEKKEKEIDILSKDKELLNKDKEIQAAKISKQRAVFLYLIFGFILIVVFGLISFRLFSQKRKTAFKQQVAEMETKLLRAQMNPHFIFNALNSIQSLILENQSRLAREYLITFSKLTRAILEQTRKKSISLSEEIDTIRMYLDLEKLRFNNKFDYTIDLKDLTNTDNIVIPPLLVQPFVENSIIHGINNKEGKGKIAIEFRKDKDSLYFIIEDDGIGREKSAEIKKRKTIASISVATQLARDRIAGMRMTKNGTSFILITDLKNKEGNSLGTKVEINIPLNI